MTAPAEIPRDPHPEARITEPVVRLPDVVAVKSAVERVLNPAERRRFRALWSDARRDPGCGIRPAIKIALRRMAEEATVRMEAAMKETGR
jgi:hypothetical protein